jgi:mannan endo-1,4-beta-mannosidase
MKKNIYLLFLLMYSFAFSQMGVSGKYITKNGNNVILRGINYPFIDDGNINLTSPSSYQYYLNEASKTGANAMRIAWYLPGTHWRDIQTPGTVQGYINNGHLGNILTYVESKNMIPILEIHNGACGNDWSLFNNFIVPFWKSTQMVSIIQAHQNNLIINLANEFGNARWTGNVTTAMTTFKTNYKNAITQLRNAGINVSIMIDAPDCGTSSSELLSVAQEIYNHDPLHKIIFSTHSYWSDYAPTTANMETKLTEMTNSGLCWFLGEIANNQDGNSCGSIDLSTLLTKLCQREIGWLAWAYDQDCSSARELTTNGVFANLTVYGNDIVHNPNYGFKSTSGCGASPSGTLSGSETNIEIKEKVYPSVFKEHIFIETNNESSFQIFGMDGKLLIKGVLNKGKNEISTANLLKGIYLFKTKTGTYKLIKN